MYCPEHLIFKRQFCQIWHIQRADVRREFVTWREVFNPLRYQISVGPRPGRYWTWNENARLNRAASNLWFRIWGHRKYRQR